MTEVEKDIDRLLNEKWTGEFLTGFISVKGFCLAKYFVDFLNAIENLEVRDDDIWVSSFPKAGTTWTQEMVWCIANNLDLEGAKVDLTTRFPYLELSALFDHQAIVQKYPEMDYGSLILNSIKYIEKMPSPRLIKTHLPFSLLPRQIRTGERKPKIVYVARNPKDTCVSYYHHAKLLVDFQGNWQEFCTLFLADKVPFASYWNHVLSYWKNRNLSNVLFNKFEDMKSDLPSIIRRTAEFLGKELKENEVKILQEHLSFKNMKKNPAVNFETVLESNKKFKVVEIVEGEFMRSGQVNQWQSEMSPEVIQQFDKLTRQYFESAGLYF